MLDDIKTPLVLQKSDAREVENLLVSLLDYDKFDLVKELVVNRLKIVWCMRLARAQDEAEKEKIEREMTGEMVCLLATATFFIPQLCPSTVQHTHQRQGMRAILTCLCISGKQETHTILNALHATRASAKERQVAMERSIREEARKLRETSDMAATKDAVARDVAGRKQIDLDALGFEMGGHFMSNRSCQLPEVRHHMEELS